MEGGKTVLYRAVMTSSALLKAAEAAAERDDAIRHKGTEESKEQMVGFGRAISGAQRPGCGNRRSLVGWEGAQGY